MKYGNFEPRLHTLEMLESCFISDVQTDMAWGFQMSYYSSSYFKGLTKLWHVKVGGPKKIRPWTHSNPFLLSKRASVRQFSLIPTMTGHSFAAPWAMIMRNYFFECYKTCIAFQLIRSETTVLSYVIFAQSNLIYVVLIW